MVKTRTAPAEITTGPTCTVVETCTSAATLQASAKCTGCQQVTEQLQADLDRRQQEHDATVARVQELTAAVRDGMTALRQLQDAPEDDDPTPKSVRVARLELDIDTLKGALRAQLDDAQRFGVGLEAAAAAAQLVQAEHTHPAFACSRHQNKLPAPLPA